MSMVLLGSRSAGLHVGVPEGVPGCRGPRPRYNQAQFRLVLGFSMIFLFGVSYVFAFCVMDPLVFLCAGDRRSEAAFSDVVAALRCTDSFRVQCSDVSDSNRVRGN